MLSETLSFSVEVDLEEKVARIGVRSKGYFIGLRLGCGSGRR